MIWYDIQCLLLLNRQEDKTLKHTEKERETKLYWIELKIKNNSYIKFKYERL